MAIDGFLSALPIPPASDHRFGICHWTLSVLRISRANSPASRRENVVHQPELPQPENDQAVDVDLVPGVRNVGVARKPVMVVVQAFTEGEDRGHELVGGAVVEI